MKKIILTMVLLTLFITKGLSQKCIVYGTTAIDLPYKYAYLYDEDTKTFLTAEITNHQFNFNLDKQDKIKILMLSFNTQLYKTYKEILESPDYKYPNRARMIALEDTVEVSLKEYTKNALVKGSRLNKDIDDMYLAIKEKKYSSFFEQHPDSPISIVFLKSLADFAIRDSPVFTMQEFKSSYNKLSENLKNSDEGKELLAIINK